MVSVIIPNYNHAAFLKQRIESILDQTYSDLELIILDDCSSDNSKSIIEQFRGHAKVSHIVYNEKNSGSTFRQWQKGISLASGSYIWIAESDDYAHTEFLSSIIAEFKKENIGLVYTQSYSVNSDGLVTGNWLEHTKDSDDKLWENYFSMNGHEFVKKYMLYQNPIPNASAVVFRKSYYDKSGGVNTDFTLNGDWYLYTKILSVSDISFISRSLNYFRYHNNKGSSSNVLNGNNVKEYYKLIGFWEKTFNLSKEFKYDLVHNAFTLWYNQFGKSVSNMLKSNFIKIFKEANKVDKSVKSRIWQKWRESTKG